MRALHWKGKINGIPHIEASPAVCFDFDGVLHEYKPPWKGDQALIEGRPVTGAKDFVDWCSIRGYWVFVHSVRTSTERGRKAVESWLARHDIHVDMVCAYKPLAEFYVDDRAVKFENNWGKIMGELTNGRG